MKGLMIWILLGTLVGIAAASFIVPPMLSWYNEAGYLSHGAAQAKTVVSLPDVMRYATTRLIRGQAIGGAIGAVAFLVVGIAIGVRGRRRAAAPPSAPAVH
jgi:hypothetical protein